MTLILGMSKEEGIDLSVMARRMHEWVVSGEDEPPDWDDEEAVMRRP